MGPCKGMQLPVHQVVDEIALLAGGALEVDAGGFDGVVAEEVGEEDDVVAFPEEVFGEEVAEGMGVDDGGVQSVFDGVEFEVFGQAAGGDGTTVAVEENGAARPVLQPHDRLGSETGRDVNPPHLAPFGIEVDKAHPDMFHPDFQELTDTHPCCRHDPHGKIPPKVRPLPEPLFEELVVLIGDHIVQEGALGHLDPFNLQVRFPQEIDILVQGADPLIRGPGLERVDKIDFVLEKVLLVQYPVPLPELLDCVLVCENGILRIILPPECLFERLVVHIESALKEVSFKY